ncbi:MAG TPA: CHAT domain-containing protein [Pyrinomonadaceae bacterium]|nr:CHAT domain-containing protein [Pyrinomonadaceae bacterium]
MCLDVIETTPVKGRVGQQVEPTIDDTALSLPERKAALITRLDAAQASLTRGDVVSAARIFNSLGNLQLVLNAPDAALSNHSQALRLGKAAGHPDIEVDALNGLAAAYLLLQDRTSAAEKLQNALELSSQIRYDPGKAQALLTLSDLQNYDNHAKALLTAQEALALWETLNDKAALARTHAQMGRCYLAQNMLPEATQNYEVALTLWQELKNAPQQAAVVIMMGFIEYRKGEWQRSISLLSYAQSLVKEEAEPRMMGQVASGLAEAFNENGAPEDGITQYSRALEYYRQTQDPHLIAYATWGLGCTYYLLGNPTEALNRFNEVLSKFPQDVLLGASSNQYLGRVYTTLGEYPKALQYLESALNVYARSANPREVAQVHALIGQVYQRQGRLDRARQSYAEALETFIRLSDRLNQAALFYALGRLELTSGKFDSAEAYLRKAIEATENIRRVSTSTDLTAAFSASVHDRYACYIECLMQQHEHDPTGTLAVRAFEISESARGRSLSEVLRATQTTIVAGLDPDLAKRETSLRQLLKVKEDYKVTLLSGKYQKEELDNLETALVQLEAEYEKIREEIRTHYPNYEQLVKPRSWNLQRIQSQVLDDDSVLLEFNLGTERSYVWAITRTTITSYELLAQGHINEIAQRVYKLLSDRPGPQSDTELAQAAKELSRIVLSPLAKELDKRRIIVAADGVLNYIPFQILPDPQTDEPLVARHEIVNTPSASILGELQEEATRRNRPDKPLVAFGAPVFASNQVKTDDDTGAGEKVASTQAAENSFERALRAIELNRESFDSSTIGPLFYADRELANLGELTPDGREFIFAGHAATRERLLHTNLTQFAILHFATHGLLDPERPEKSGLVLSTIDPDGTSQNGFVSLQDIYGLRAPVDLVVLSACQTALGKDVRGEGLLGLTRGFMYAGASSVVASLWKVDDEATAELMKDFYVKMLEKGMTPSAALREAQNTVRLKPEWKSPHYWAAFTFQGNYNQAIKIKAVTISKVKVAVVATSLLSLSILLVSWYYWRRRGRGSVIIPQ